MSRLTPPFAMSRRIISCKYHNLHDQPSLIATCDVTDFALQVPRVTQVLAAGIWPHAMCVC